MPGRGRVRRRSRREGTAVSETAFEWIIGPLSLRSGYAACILRSTPPRRTVLPCRPARSIAMDGRYLLRAPVTGRVSDMRGASVSGYLTVGLAPARCRDISSLPDTSLDGLQLPPIFSEGFVERGQEGSQVGLGKQVAFDLENQALELGTICSRHGPNDKQAISQTLSKTAHCDHRDLSAWVALDEGLLVEGVSDSHSSPGSRHCRNARSSRRAAE